MKRALGLALTAVMLLPGAAGAQNERDLCLRVDKGVANLETPESVTYGFEKGWIEILEVVDCAQASPSPSPEPEPTGHELDGVMSLTDKDAKYKKGKTCRGKGGYDDMRKGTQVTVRDAAGTLLGVGTLSAGEARSKSECWFYFIVEDVPDSDIYAIEVGHRGELVYTFDDLEEREWFITPALG